MPHEPRSSRVPRRRLPSVFQSNPQNPSTSPQSPRARCAGLAGEGGDRVKTRRRLRGNQAFRGDRIHSSSSRILIRATSPSRCHRTGTRRRLRAVAATSLGKALSHPHLVKGAVCSFSPPRAWVSPLSPDALPLRRVAWSFPSFEFIHSPSCKARAHPNSDSYR